MAIELWRLGAQSRVEMPEPAFKFALRNVCTQGYGQDVILGVPGLVWGWVREDRPADPDLLAYGGRLCLDLELKTWAGECSAEDAAPWIEAGAVDVTSHGYPKVQHREALGALAEAGGTAYPQIYEPSQATLTPERFAQRCLAMWRELGFDRVVALVSPRDGAYALRVAAECHRRGSDSAVWAWPAVPSRGTRKFGEALGRLLRPT